MKASMRPPPPPAAGNAEAPKASRPWREALRRGGLLALLIAVAVAAQLSGVLDMLTPAALGREQAALRTAVTVAPAAALALYVLVYIVLTGACLPVAMMLSLAGGAIFGVAMAASAVVIGATGGAMLTYAAARSAFAPLLRARAERDQRLHSLLKGFERDAFTYILTLRFLPMAPFALVNVASGLAAVPLRSYALATLVGALPTSVIYTSLGAGLGASLAQRSSLRQALHSPELLAPLAALAVLAAAPLAVRRLRRRRD
jgi:uncharacterized membrane protein YdjX (TVP38/TMEM64 family)